MREVTFQTLLKLGGAMDTRDTPKEYNFLYAAFVALWWRSGAVGDLDPVFDDLVKRYGEKHRHYHTLAHIAHCFRELEGVRHLVSDRNAVEYFIFFHDAVYDTKAGALNEPASIVFFKSVAEKARLSEEVIEKASDFIFMSRFHRNPLGDPDCALALDIDMSILGADAPVYDAYVKALREEYRTAYNDKEFSIGRVGWIFGTLDNPPIFLTEVFQKKYEERAVANLKEELKQLQNPP